LKLVEILAGAEVALRVLQERLVLMVCMLITAGLFSWAMWLQTVLGAMIALAWGLAIFLPVLFAGRGDSDERPQRPQNEPPEGSQG
jgi:hypothetical protein